MEWVKTTAKTLPEAIDLALDNLGVDESEAEIVVLEEPRPGLFGRMRGTARVEARVKPKPIRPKVERNRKRSRPEGGRSRDRSRKQGGGGDRRPRSDDQGGSGSSRSSRGGGRDGGKGGEGRGRRGERSGGDDREARSSDGRNAGRRNGGSGGGERKAPTKERAATAKDTALAAGEGASVEEVAAHLKTFLTDLTEAFGFDSDVTIDETDGEMLVGRIEGRHGLLVGPKGRTLDAVQELARISCQRAVPSSIRIKVDVGGYREQRAKALGEFAAQAADKAVADGVEVAMEPMSPADRKAVHDALNGDDRVETRSVGSEPRRKVLVVPLAADEVDDEPDEVEDDASAAGSDEEE